MSTIVQSEPCTFEEVVKQQVWKDAMNEEYESIMKNDAWDVIPRPNDKSVVTSERPYKIKHGAYGNSKTLKAKFVPRRFSQKEGVDYDEIFASEAVYVEQPEGFEVQYRETHVCRLKKVLYELKQAPRAWYERIDSYLMKLGFTRSDVDPNLYFKFEKDKPCLLVLYVDDLFLTGDDLLIHQCKREFASEFKMKDLGLMHYFLRLEVWQKPSEIFISQGKYIVELLERCGIIDCKSVTTSMELNFKKLCGSVVGPRLENPTKYPQFVGGLMLLVNSRPDICFVMNTLSQYMVDPHHIHWLVAKNLLRYLRGTIHYALRYIVENLRLHGYSNVVWARSVVDRKIMSGCCFYLGSTSISWMSKKKKSVALSTTEAEYIAASMACCKFLWLRKLFIELFEHVLNTTVIFCYNQSWIHLS
eukprot:PITA_22449